MILLDSTAQFPSPLVARLADELFSLCEPARELTPSERNHLAVAVAFFLSEQPYLPHERSALSHAAARAIHSIGYPRAAHRVLAVSFGLLRPLASELAQGIPAWGLDLLPLVANPQSRCELLLFRALDALLRAAVPLWDKTTGLGLLALRHTEPAAAALLGPHASRRQKQELRQEMLAFCRRRFKMFAEEKQWTTGPHVFLLDGSRA